MTEAYSTSKLDEFIAWLKQVIKTNPNTRVHLAEHLGAGGEEKIDRDLRGSYLPDWLPGLAGRRGLCHLVSSPVRRRRCAA